MGNKMDLRVIIRFLSRECTEAERAMVQKWMEDHPSLKKSINAMQHIWNAKETPVHKEDIDVIWQRVKAKIDLEIQREKQKTQKSLWSFDLSHIFPNFSVPTRRILQFATVFIIILMGSYSIFNRGEQKTKIASEQYRIISIDKGKRMNMVLSDGTRITLDAGSKLKCPDIFKDTRDVYLTGEAYFEVAHDQNRPFRVHANHALVQVLGTKFNVRAWNENPAVSVAVVEGKVSLGHVGKTKSNQAIIPKGYYSLLPDQGLPSTPTQVDIKQYLGWMHNEIRFRDVTVRETLAQLERWYNLEFVVNDESILKQRITVHIQQTNIDDLLELISYTIDKNIIRNGKVITIETKQN